MVRSAFFAAAIAVAVPGAAQAAWLYQELGSAFDENKIHVAMGVARDYAIGVRCTGPSDTEVIFATPEDLKDASADTINAVEPKLLLRVDQNPAVTVAGVIEAAPNGMRIIAAAPDGFSEQVRDAKSGVSVAIEIMGQVMHETKFDVSGSTAAVKQMQAACKAP